MEINPQDILISRSGEVLHVQEVEPKENSSQIGGLLLRVRDCAGALFTREVNNPKTEISQHITGVSALDAEAYYDHERVMDILDSEARNKDFKALYRYRLNCPKLVYTPSLVSADSVATRSMFEYLDAAEREISEAVTWAKQERAKYLEKVMQVTDLTLNAPTYSEPELSEQSVRLNNVYFRVGGIYRYQFNPVGAVIGYKLGYAQVTAVDGSRAYVTLPNGQAGYLESAPYHYAIRLVMGDKKFDLYANAVELLPIGSFKDIWDYTLHESMTSAFLEKVFVNTYLDMFSEGEGKPLCLPPRWELEGTLSEYLSAERCRAHILKRITEMILDMRKSVSHVRWVRGELEEFYAGV